MQRGIVLQKKEECFNCSTSRPRPILVCMQFWQFCCNQFAVICAARVKSVVMMMSLTITSISVFSLLFFFGLSAVD